MELLIAPPRLRCKGTAGGQSVQGFEIMHLVEIVNEPGLLCRVHPSRCCVSVLEAGMSIPAKKPSQPK